MFKHQGRCRSVLLPFAVFALFATYPKCSHAGSNWFNSQGYGFWVHGFYQLDGNPNATQGLTNASEWQVNTETFASNVQSMGGTYVVLSVGGFGVKWLHAPNAKYRGYTGYAQNQADINRDLILDLSNSLNARGIRLYLYVNAQGPFNDAQARSGLGMGSDLKVNTTFIQRWADCVQEFSDRYGSRISGYFIDHDYTSIGYTTPNLINPIISACRHGNPNALVALNHDSSRTIGNGQQTMEFGEVQDPATQYEPCEFRDGMYSHLNSWTGPAGWTSRGCRYSNDQMRNLLQNAIVHGNCVSMEIIPDTSGWVDGAQRSQFQAIQSAIHRYQNAGNFWPGKPYLLSSNQSSPYDGADAIGTGEYLVSPSRNYFAIQQTDGNFCIYRGSGPWNNQGYVWSTGATASGGQFRTWLGSDGNLRTLNIADLNNWSTIWQFGVGDGQDNYYLALQDDGNLVVSHNVPWSPGRHWWDRIWGFTY